MPEGNRGVFGYTEAISSGTSASIAFVLPGSISTGGMMLHRMKINAPGVSAATAVYAYDGTSGTSQEIILGGARHAAGSPVPLAAQPDNGFIFEGPGARKVINSGSIALYFEGNTQNSKNVYVAGEYTQ